ncbi:MAG: protein kinase, partial [Gemmatimonadales bacterium]|nr:protein kinase [Gemmatimonadales bacterium]NIN10239.1 protein kinase [Gemmatimonadales bacterium]NIN49036.1 protein kinase [Gemmatimonadales bacterium]NIP06500.1 protein kinase [Gemmatimonadales bacterium]NIQ98843.1 protein kinase [Gemmatimonadales bacterium]
LPKRYTVERLIGRGGMATVYLARESHPNRQVAIKVLDPQLAARLGPERFLREVDLASNLTHPHIVPIYAAGEAAGLLYYVMPYISGETLRQRITRLVQLPFEDALRLACETASALQYAHERNVIHRDIKPENILLHDDHALVADFGVARAISAAGSDSLTETGATLGTPAYMSPEQVAADRDIDGRTDVYALACVLYEMLSGDPPFTGRTARVVLARQITDPVPPLRAARDTVPVALEQVITRGLAKAPADRFPTARQFSEALVEAAGVGLSLSSHPGAALRQRSARRRRWLRLGTVAVAVAAVTMIWWQPWSRTMSPAYAGTRYVDSLAVIPIRNPTGDTVLTHVAEAVTYDIISHLHQLDGLKVITLHSVEALVGTKLTTPQLAESLKVRLFLEAQLRRRGNTTLANAWLVDAATDAYLWNDTRELDLTDLGAAERAMVGWMGEGVVAHVNGLEPPTPTVRTQHSRGSEAYLLGKHWLARRTADGITRAIAAFQQALAADSGHAAAYAGLSSAYALSLIYRYQTGSDGYRTAGLALAMASRAIELDPGLADGYAARGYIASRSFAPPATVASDCDRVMELKPNAPEGPSWCALVYAKTGRLETAFAEAERGIALDPQSAARRLSLAYQGLTSRRYEIAVREARIAAELEPELMLPHAIEARALLLDGRAGECAIEELGPHEVIRATCLYELGRVEEATSIVDSVAATLASGSGRDTVFTDVIRAEDLASYYAWIGDAWTSLTWLTRAFELSPSGVELRVLESALFDRVRADPDFARGVERIRGGIWQRVLQQSQLVTKLLADRPAT